MSERQFLDWLLDRALRSQGVVSLGSIAQLAASLKPAMAAVIEARVKRRVLVPVLVPGAGKTPHWMARGTEAAVAGELVHVLSPFDPLVIQRRRFNEFFGYDHRFEAYVPKAKRKLGYFALPVLVGDRIVAAIDTKADRAGRKLLIQQWTWLGDGPRDGDKALIEEELERFERFQLEG